MLRHLARDECVAKHGCTAEEVANGVTVLAVNKKQFVNQIVYSFFFYYIGLLMASN